MKVLLVEDDPDLGRALLRSLRDESIETIWVRRMQEARAQIKQVQFSCIVLDINLPDGEGFELLKGLRIRKEAIPVIMMTAREALDDRLRAFNDGADDYIIKPFAVPELLARVHAVTRRAAGFADTTWTLGEIDFLSAQRIVKVSGQEIALTPMELALLEKLIRAPQRVITRQALLENIWPVNETPSDGSLEVLVHGLRKKLGVDQLKTVRGVGYLLSSK